MSAYTTSQLAAAFSPGEWTAFSGATRTSDGEFVLDPDTNGLAVMESLHEGSAVKTYDSVTQDWHYHLVYAVTSNNLGQIAVSVNGEAISATTSLWYYGGPSMVEQRIISVPGNFNDATNTDLILSDLKTYFRWNGDDARLVHIETKCITADGTADPELNITIGGTNVLPSGIAVNTNWAYGKSNSYVGSVVFNDLLEITIDKGAGGGLAQDLTVVLTFVKEKNSRSDLDPGANPPVYLVISGITGTWKGFSDGVFIIKPDSYTLTAMPTTGSALVASEKWTFYSSSTTSQYLKFNAKLSMSGTVPVTTAAASSVKLRVGPAVTGTTTPTSSVFHTRSYSFPGDPAPWPGRIRDRLMGTASFASLGGATFTWSKLGHRWYNG